MAEPVKRSSPRYQAGLPVVCRVAGGTEEEAAPSLIGMTWNVSLGGLQAELPAPPPEGPLDLLLRVGDRTVAARGRVAWVHPTAEGVRCGLAFTGISLTRSYLLRRLFEVFRAHGAGTITAGPVARRRRSF